MAVTEAEYLKNEVPDQKSEAKRFSQMIQETIPEIWLWPIFPRLKAYRFFFRFFFDFFRFSKFFGLSQRFANFRFWAANHHRVPSGYPTNRFLES